MKRVTCGACLKPYPVNYSQMCPHRKLVVPTQTERLLAWLRINPGATGLEIVTVLRIPKYTSRISDLRARGVVVECRSVEGVDRYVVVEPPTVTTGEPVSLWESR